MARHFILATAGHVDHGKSALVTALTDTDPDRLPEEKARGITIELGFAELSLRADESGDEALQVGIIDVPGHEDFVKNMVAGVGCVNLGLVVVAADDGWMPQTEEHLQILEYLGVAEVIVALNKIDLAEDDEEFLVEVVREELSGSAFPDAKIVATSTVSGKGIEELKRMLEGRFQAMPDPADFGKPRLAVDRVFSVKGHGTVVTGSLVDGSLESGQTVVVQPQGLASRIRTLQCFGHEVAVSRPGSRLAVNLASVAVRESGASAHEGVGRGDVITVESIAVSSSVIDCLLTKSSRLEGRQVSAAKPLKHGSRIRLHHGSANIPGRVFFLDCEAVKPGERVAAQLRLECPAMVLTGDRFVLRDWSEVHTLAGGLVLEPEADARRLRDPRQRKFFEHLLAKEPTLEVMVRALVERSLLFPPGRLLGRSAFDPAAIAAAVAALASSGDIVERDGWVFEASFWRSQVAHSAELIDRFHQQHSELSGISLNELRSHLDPAWKDGVAFALLTRALVDDGFVVAGNVIRRKSHEISLPAALAPAAAQIRSALGKKPTDPPGRKQLLGAGDDERALRFLIESGEVVDVSDEIVMTTEGYATLERLVRAFLAGRDGATVSELRQETGVSRRIMLPVLAHLDASGVTVREGDVRRLGTVT